MEIQNIVRNGFGLFRDVNYVLNDKGLVDWRKMINPEFLVPNAQKFEKQGKTVPVSIEGLEDKDLLILLGGIKDLARLRGYTRVSHVATSPTPEYVVSVCTIDFIPNFETEGHPVTFSAIGDAGVSNTNGFGRLYLGPIAENRAFVRAVRNFLNINIAGQDELSPKSVEDTASATPTSPAALLEQLLVEKSVSFDELKAKLVKEGVENASNFAAVSDIPTVKVFELIQRLKKKT
jgi:hypothetical protein